MHGTEALHAQKTEVRMGTKIPFSINADGASSRHPNQLANAAGGSDNDTDSTQPECGNCRPECPCYNSAG